LADIGQIQSAKATLYGEPAGEQRYSRAAIAVHSSGSTKDYLKDRGNMCHNLAGAYFIKIQRQVYLLRRLF
jgi:hypothetical protein